MGRLHVLDAEGHGRLPPLVLLHGLSSTGVHYLPLVRHVQPHVQRLVLPDLPGHGFSDAPPNGMRGDALARGLREALDEVLHEPAVIFGNSLGALAAIRYARERPDRVRGLFLCSPGGAPMSEQDLTRFLDTFRVETHASAVAFVDRVFGRRTSLRHVVAWGVRRRMRHPTIRNLIESVTVDGLLSAEELSDLQMPVWLSWGRRDGVLPREHFDFFREHLPGHAVVHEPADHGHSPYLEDAQGVGHAIVDFLVEVQRAQLPE
ncbi:MAG: alpha/beta hydrolase [Polyangiaceae bacterium]|nr:alpha/beta hydrolase [Polyangiaceae bacterium]